MKIENIKLKIDAGQTDRRPKNSRARLTVFRRESRRMAFVRFDWLRICACVIMILQTSPLSAGSPKTPSRGGQLERQLWKDNVSPPDQSHANSKTDKLKQMIEQVRSIQFESPAAGKTEPQQPATPEDEKQKIESQPSSDVVVVSAVNNDKSMSNQTLHKVEELLKDPNAIANPLELAEVLFQTGSLGPAGLCYKQALVSIAADDPNVASERAWILFQIGNCLIYDDPNGSKESYAELIRTHPGSPWTEIAKSRHGLLDWYQQDQPRKLIEELKQ